MRGREDDPSDALTPEQIKSLSPNERAAPEVLRAMAPDERVRFLGHVRLTSAAWSFLSPRSRTATYAGPGQSWTQNHLVRQPRGTTQQGDPPAHRRARASPTVTPSSG